MKRPALNLLAAIAALLMLSACAGQSQPEGRTQPSSPSTAAAPSTTGRDLPVLEVRRAVRGLNIAWDAVPLNNEQVLVSERDRFQLTLANLQTGAKQVVAAEVPEAWSSGETGLMSIALADDFASSGRFFTCQGMDRAGTKQVGIMAWTMNPERTKATPESAGAQPGRVVLDGIEASSGRHGGCRILLVGNQMYVGTGDAAIGSNPQDRTSLNGKVLRLDATTGQPWPSNPWITSDNPSERYVFTYGHRNVQGLARRNNGQIWSVEHGPDRDDEVNLVTSGANYGWDPVPGYNESRPMTKRGSQPAKWTSGSPTPATSGASFVSGPGWQAMDGALAVAELKGQALRFLIFDEAGQLLREWVPKALTRFGRLRSVHQLPNQDLVVTTSNGGGGESPDEILIVHPAGRSD